MQVFGKTVAESTIGLPDIKEASLGTSNGVYKVRDGAHKPLSDYTGFCALYIIGHFGIYYFVQKLDTLKGLGHKP